MLLGKIERNRISGCLDETIRIEILLPFLGISERHAHGINQPRERNVFAVTNNRQVLRVGAYCRAEVCKLTAVVEIEDYELTAIRQSPDKRLPARKEHNLQRCFV